MSPYIKYYFGILFLFSCYTFSQDIELFRQYNGRYSYTAIGNTLNEFENNIILGFCETLPSSEAELELTPSSPVVAAFLYWAGSGDGDTEVTLNGTAFSADTVYNVDYDDPNYGLLTYFSCFKDITHFVQDTGDGIYSLSDLDVSDALASNIGYCENRTNFAGWSIYVIYQNNLLPLNQINLFQGLEIINRNVQELDILLENVNVLDNEGAKIGFLAWEGDRNLNYGESLLINGNLISNPPLNPVDNAFNGTNSFTNSSTFYNCDLDVYNIENNIAIGDTSVEITLTTGAVVNGILFADLIILNNVITVLNSQLPDATVQIDDTNVECASRLVDVAYTIFNTNSTEVLPAGTPIAFYADTVLVGQSTTQNPIVIGGSESGSITLNIPDTVPDAFTLTIVVDDMGSGNGIVVELNETNNTITSSIELIPAPVIMPLDPLLACDIGFNTATFDLTTQLAFVVYSDINDVAFYTSLEDLMSETGAINIPEFYQNTSVPQTIYIRVTTELCYEAYAFELLVENCPPHVPQVFTPNNDGYNDWFNIQGLYDIFERHQLLIYNRWGTLIFEGDNNNRWEGVANRGVNNQGKLLPVGTYFYILHLNDPNYQSLNGWVYLTH